MRARPLALDALAFAPVLVAVFALAFAEVFPAAFAEVFPAASAEVRDARPFPPPPPFEVNPAGWPPSASPLPLRLGLLLAGHPAGF